MTGDVGDHVVVINTRHIAMEGDLWRTFIYYHYTGYALCSTLECVISECNITTHLLYCLFVILHWYFAVERYCH